MNLTLDLALWIATGLLAAVLLVSTAKIFVPRERIAAAGRAAEWVLEFDPWALRARARLWASSSWSSMIAIRAVTSAPPGRGPARARRRGTAARVG